MPTPVPQAGDILLMMSTDELSKLIAWLGDSPYSHSALMISDTQLMESIASGVTKTDLQDLKRADFKVKFLDVFRTLDAAGNSLNTAQLAAVRVSAEKFEGIPFEFSKLIQIGVLAAVRQKLPMHAIARHIIRIAFDHLLANNEKAMTCSQFVYTTLMQAGVAPEPSVTPRITVFEPSGLAFPNDMDWFKLVEEIKALLPEHERALVSMQLNAVDQADPSVYVLDAALAEQAHAVRLALGFTDELQLRYTNLPFGEVIDNPNPKLVSPQDLYQSPDHQAFGRWFEL